MNGGNIYVSMNFERFSVAKIKLRVSLYLLHHNQTKKKTSNQSNNQPTSFERRVAAAVISVRVVVVRGLVFVVSFEVNADHLDERELDEHRL